MTRQKHRTAEDQQRWQVEQETRTKGCWQVGLVCSQGSMTAIGTHQWRTEVEALAVDGCDLVTHHHDSDVSVLQAVVAELTAPSATVD